MAYWLLKSEPETFSIEHLAKMPNQISPWDGVRNYQVRNMLRDQMHCGDLGFFYHSSCKIPGIVGIVEIVREGYPDHSAFDPKSQYYDPDSDPTKPRWYMVDVKLRKKFSSIITLNELKTVPALQQMPLLRRGNRLSIMPVTPEEWEAILNLSTLETNGF